MVFFLKSNINQNQKHTKAREMANVRCHLTDGVFLKSNIKVVGI